MEDEGPSNFSGTEKKRHKGKHDKPKPWDEDPNIDRWKIEKFDPSWNSGGMLEKSSFETLFPQYREKYLQEVWPAVKSALKEHGIACELNLVKGFMRVETTIKTRDPYIIVKARDLCWLLARSVPAPQALKILEDGMYCDIIRIGNLVKNKSRFVKRRQRLVGPNSSTLKALEILSGCYILVQGATVAAMGTSVKSLKQIRRVVEDCIQNKMHPLYHIKILMMKKELEKDPNLKEENWDRFLPKFKKKQPKKEISEEKKEEAKERKKKKEEKDARKKKNYTPFPPPQPLSLVDMQLESGEYFLSEKKKQKMKWQEKMDKQEEKKVENKRKRDASFIPPKEPIFANGKARDNISDIAAIAVSLKKKSKGLKKEKLEKNVVAEDYIAEI